MAQFTIARTLALFCFCLGSAAGPADGREKNVRNSTQLRAALRGSPDNVTIRLVPGRYELTDTLTIRRARNVQLLGPAQGPPAVLSGSILLPSSQWSRVADSHILARLRSEEARGRLVEYRLTRAQRRGLGRLTRRGFEAGRFSETPPAALVFDKRLMTLARWPNDEPVPVAHVFDPGPRRSQGDDAWYQRGGVFRVSTLRMTRWTQANEVWIDGILGRDWHWTFNRARKIFPDRGIVELRYGEVEGIRNDDWLHPGVQFVNLLEEIDEAGEYYIDRADGRVFFLPPLSRDSAGDRTELTWMQDPLLRISQSSNITVQGIVFEGGRSHGLEIEGASDVVVNACIIRNFGGDGIRADGRNLRIEKTSIAGTGACGIRLAGGDLKSLSSSGNAITHCKITRNAQVDKVFNPAVSLEGAGHVVRACSFSDLPHMAIEVTGNDFLIEGNTFTGTSRRFRDMGAIYANTGNNPEMRGTIIRGNLFHDIAPGGRSCGAIYLDNGSCGFTIERNAFHRVGDHEDSWAVMIHGGGENTVRENLFVECARPVHVAYWWNGYGKDEFTDQLRFWKQRLPRLSRHLARYPEMKGFFDTDRRLPDTNTFTRNLIVTRNQPLLHGTVATAHAGPPERLQQSGNILTTRDPGFFDMDKGHLALGPHAPVLEQLPHLKGMVLPRPAVDQTP